MQATSSGDSVLGATPTSILSAEKKSREIVGLGGATMLWVAIHGIFGRDLRLDFGKATIKGPGGASLEPPGDTPGEAEH